MAGNKFILIAAGITIVIFLIGVFSLSGKTAQSNDSTVKAISIAANPDFFDLGEVPINGGLVTREYKVENTSQEVVKLKRIATSCMCTNATIELKGEKSKEFSMESPGDKNAPVNMEFLPGDSAIVTVIFDPAAHGPKGVGAFDRTVVLYFAENVGIKELKFKGIVIGS